MYVCMCVCVYAQYVCMHSMCVCTVCVYAQYVCMHSMCVCTVCVYAQYVCMYLQSTTCTYRLSHKHMQVHNTVTHMHFYPYMFTHTPHTYTRTHTHTHTRTHTHTDTHTHAHTHIHTDTQTHLPGVHPSLHEEVLRCAPVAHGEVDKASLLLDTQEVLVEEGERERREGDGSGRGPGQARVWQEASDGGHDVNTYVLLKSGVL